MQTYSDNTIKNIRSVLSGTQSVKILKTPEERHQLVLHWNWDDGIGPLQWIIRQPDTDWGTILLIYWLSQPGNQKQRQESELIQEIEKNIKDEYYQNSSITFDPKNFEGEDLTLNSSGVTSGNVIPSIMYRVVEGKTIERTKLNKQYINRILPLKENDLKKLKKNITNGFLFLSTYDPTITQESRPEDILSLLQKIQLDYEKRNTEITRKDSINFKYLDFVFAEQVCRAYGWNWYFHELREQIIDEVVFIIVSINKEFYWSQIGHFFKSNINCLVPWAQITFEGLKDQALAQKREEYELRIKKVQDTHPEYSTGDICNRYGIHLEIAFLTLYVPEVCWNR